MRYEVIREVVVGGATHYIVDVYDERGRLVVGGVMTSDPAKTMKELERNKEQEAEDGSDYNS